MISLEHLSVANESVWNLLLANSEAEVGTLEWELYLAKLKPSGFSALYLWAPFIVCSNVLENPGIELHVSAEIRTSSLQFTSPNILSILVTYESYCHDISTRNYLSSKSTTKCLLMSSPNHHFSHSSTLLTLWNGHVRESNNRNYVYIVYENNNNIKITEMLLDGWQPD